MDLYALARPLLFLLPPEDAHHLSLIALKTGLFPGARAPDDPALRVTLWDRNFPNPVGLAAGFDKDAEVIGPALRLGFGFVEAGTVTPKAQSGNPRPRLFRCPEHDAVINRMGFNNKGLEIFRENLSRFLARKPRPAGPVGISIGMNKTQTEPEKDYCALVRALGPMADYLAINISSPNTPGLRDLQKKAALTDLLGRILDERKKSCGPNPPPLLVKLMPDLTDAAQEEIAESVLEAGIDGLILTNTTVSRPGSLPEPFRGETGGLSGAPVREMATRSIRRFYVLTKGRLPIIGVGGISSGADAYEKIRAGASLVQIYSALVFKGPWLAAQINRELLELVKKDGLSHVSEAVGAEHKRQKAA